MVRRILPTVLDTKYKIILDEERRLAKTVAKGIVKMPKLTVWAFMIPLVFFITFLKYKRDYETFVLNLMFTKKLALEAALNIVKKGVKREEAIARLDEKTSSILASDKEGIYSEKIRRKQIYEVNLLLDHYLKLFEVEGKSYESLVKNAYQTKDNYETFLQQLTAAEKAVNQAALQAVGRTETTRQVVSEMEKALESLRKEQVKKIFP